MEKGKKEKKRKISVFKGNPFVVTRLQVEVAKSAKPVESRGMAKWSA